MTEEEYLKERVGILELTLSNLVQIMMYRSEEHNHLSALVMHMNQAQNEIQKEYISENIVDDVSS